MSCENSARNSMILFGSCTQMGVQSIEVIRLWFGEV